MLFPFIKYTKFWFGFSILILVVGIVAMVNNQIKFGSPLVYGIDFTGGTLMEVHFDASVQGDQTQKIHEAVDAIVPGTVKQITVTDKGDYVIQGKDLTNEQHDQAKESMKQKIGNFEEIRFTVIGPKISSTLKQKALFALGVAMIAIVFYIAYAFRRIPKRVSPWRFGITAIIALLHDVLSTIGVFALMRYEVDALFITALLTVVGFSVHDTIVVFDRIRENLKKQTREQTFSDVADISLNQTIGRSINTSLSVLITLTALYIFGADSIKIFVFALLFGIFIGTYSSIFVATPLLTLWQEKTRQR